MITGEIATGEIYSVPALAKQLGVSATPVREALLDLASEGLVESVRNRGFRVLELDDHDLDEIFELRTLLEVPCAGQVAGRLTQPQIARLELVLQRLELAAESGELAAYLNADHDFHAGLLEPIGNKRLLDLVMRLRNQQRLYGLPRLVKSAAFMATALEHRAVFDEVVAGNGARAELLMRQHLSHTRGIWAGIREPEFDLPN